MILCVGEQLAERDAGRAVEVVDAQLRGASPAPIPAALERGRATPPLTIAYEPVWAIGTGRNARGADAAEMAGAIRSDAGAPRLRRRRRRASRCCTAAASSSANIDEFMAEPSIDGALVGGASLKPDEMAAIVARAGLTAARPAAAAGA